MIGGPADVPILYYTQRVTNDKAKPAERRGQKATGPRFLREATDDSPKDRKIAGPPEPSHN